MHPTLLLVHPATLKNPQNAPITPSLHLSRRWTMPPWTVPPAFKNGTMLPFTHSLVPLCLRCIVLSPFCSFRWRWRWRWRWRYRRCSVLQWSSTAAYEVRSVRCVLVYCISRGSSWPACTINCYGSSMNIRIKLIRLYNSLPRIKYEHTDQVDPHTSYRSSWSEENISINLIRT